jgi:hypothetical protein
MRIPLVASRRNVVIAAALAGLVALLATLLATQLGGPAPASAADHRDAPGLTPPGGDNRADITDIYAFQEPGHPGKSILVLNVNGLTPAGTPAYFGERVPTVAADQRIDYYLYVDKNGDAPSAPRRRSTAAAACGSSRACAMTRSSSIFRGS